MAIHKRILNLSSLVLVSFFVIASAEVFFEERFDDGWESRWVKSDWEKDVNFSGEWILTSGKWNGDPNDKVFKLVTFTSHKFYAISAKFPQATTRPRLYLYTDWNLLPPKRIKDPNYKGKGEAPMIDNPDHNKINVLFCQENSGTLFDNILEADDVEYAKELAEETWGKHRDAEKAAFEEAEKKRKGEVIKMVMEVSPKAKIMDGV
ncbi:Calreticulin [Hibiscus syriacus]|uniref:Calreticulin n=1 Tax=Hibiscus syriacus TaxID=106335 RepID=A0A6A3BAE5_HIBSY|nr:Calreticulin [Hibiscus syriacus]